MRAGGLRDGQHHQLTVALWWLVAYLLLINISLNFGHRTAAKPSIAI